MSILTHNTHHTTLQYKNDVLVKSGTAWLWPPCLFYFHFSSIAISQAKMSDKSHYTADIDMPLR